MVKQRGFLLLEASVSLFLACLGVTLLFYTLGQTKKINQNIDRRIDRAYASYVLNNTSKQQVTVHDHLYEQAGADQVLDKTMGKVVYEVK
ncbi:hypothetical protein J2Z60_001040 [Lactobacillus colini]|uniref:Type II secretion system protein n=1 Tax=Lactobacillus colini TaxID=1819254 RepID=A0ABS4ME25_9LACO|nr:type II secretion system protein [Lactobacillus colini]MBP2057868.1 hypothetical protein [Lactobacillus colini]